MRGIEGQSKVGTNREAESGLERFVGGKILKRTPGFPLKNCGNDSRSVLGNKAKGVF